MSCCHISPVPQVTIVCQFKCIFKHLTDGSSAVLSDQLSEADVAVSLKCHAVFISKKEERESRAPSVCKHLVGGGGGRGCLQKPMGHSKCYGSFWEKMCYGAGSIPRMNPGHRLSISHCNLLGLDDMRPVHVASVFS